MAAAVAEHDVLHRRRPIGERRDAALHVAGAGELEERFGGAVLVRLRGRRQRHDIGAGLGRLRPVGQIGDDDAVPRLAHTHGDVLAETDMDHLLPDEEGLRSLWRVIAGRIARGQALDEEILGGGAGGGESPG